ncbi:uncharacterized protein [Diabrotica undecimpunctata]|uniref:uncharacterized protein n=1 Tax=Diabrotica undecimpunctata TaxID=50387 RepID=UPI003B636ED2
MKQILFGLFCLLLVLQLSEAIPTTEIRDGNCLNAVASDLVYQEHIHKSRILIKGRQTTAKYYGDKKIYCIIATSQKDASKGSTVEIKGGGVNHNFVNFEFNSTKNHGLEYNIQVYARYF